MKLTKRKRWMALGLAVVVCLAFAGAWGESSVAAATTKKAKTPLEEHGALQEEGTKLVDQNGDTMQLYGMSTHGIAWFPEYINKKAFKTLRDDWKTNCIRLAMYTNEYN